VEKKSDYPSVAFSCSWNREVAGGSPPPPLSGCRSGGFFPLPLPSGRPAGGIRFIRRVPFFLDERERTDGWWSMLLFSTPSFILRGAGAGDDLPWPYPPLPPPPPYSSLGSSGGKVRILGEERVGVGEPFSSPPASVGNGKEKHSKDPLHLPSLLLPPLFALSPLFSTTPSDFLPSHFVYYLLLFPHPPWTACRTPLPVLLTFFLSLFSSPVLRGKLDSPPFSFFFSPLSLPPLRRTVDREENRSTSRAFFFPLLPPGHATMEV